MSIETAGERARNLPEIIQGGMGIAVSDHKLAGSVAAMGELGIVSGTVIGPVLARRLQDGDPGGYMLKALAAFPDQKIADEIINTYYLPEGRPEGKPYKAAPMIDAKSHHKAEKLNMVGAFAEVWSAKDLARQLSPNPGPIGINLLTKLQAPTISALYGAMLAGVDCGIMGAGNPHEIPKVLSDLASEEKTSIQFDVTGARNNYYIEFDPKDYPILRDVPKFTPAFLAIVSSVVLAKRLAGNPIPPQGFVIEGPTAGGHNAPPRNKKILDERGDPIYGERDIVNLSEISQIDLPFWLAGSCGNPEGLKSAKSENANGIQVGSAFALCQDSGLSNEYRDYLIEKALNGGIDIVTDFKASPTGFPFKVPSVSGTLSEIEVYEGRQRVCDLGYLREAYAIDRPNGSETIGYRCASEPIEDYLKKGGKFAATIGRKCLCNGLMSAIDLGQFRPDGRREDTILTIGDNANEAAQRLVSAFDRNFSASDVINWLRGSLSNSRN